MEFLKSLGGKVVGGAVALAVVAGGISWWRMDQPARDSIVSGVGWVMAWGAVVLMLPWAGFFLIGKVARLDSNAAGATLVMALTAAEALLLAWLFDWSIRGAPAWVFFSAAVLVAGVYNLFTCDWIAEKAG